MIPHECPECEEQCACVVGDVDLDACEHVCYDEDDLEEEDDDDDGSGFFDSEEYDEDDDEA